MQRGIGWRTWSEEEDNLLRKCVAERLSSEETARLMGKTRNAVGGRAHRLGLVFLGHDSELAKNYYGRTRVLRKTQRRSIKAAQTKHMAAIEADGPELGRTVSSQFAKPVTLAAGYSYFKGKLSRNGKDV